LSLVAAVRLDNRDELVAQLRIPKETDGTITDSDVIIAAYRRWGTACAEHLAGDFAFALWDPRIRRLYCARDHFGVQPFYYYLSRNLFIFSTELKALLLSEEVPKTINEIRLLNHLRSNFEDRESTFYKHVLRLAPGNAIAVSRGGGHALPYWTLELPEELKLQSDSQYAEMLRECFTTAVKRRFKSSERVGTMLSGGLDSSSITCVALRLLTERGDENWLHTFSAVYQEVKECDEREYMTAVINGKNIKPHFITADKFGPFVDIDEVMESQDEPLLLGNLYLSWLLFKEANREGIKVVLDGFDGDNTISHGTGVFTELALRRNWAKLGWEVSAFSRRRRIPLGRAVWSWYSRYLFNPLLARSTVTVKARNGVRSIKGKIVSGKRTFNGSHVDEHTVELNPKFREANDWISSKKERQAPPRTEREAHLCALQHNGNPFTLEVLSRAAGASSIDVRFPFWDKDLIEFCLSIPASQKIKNGWTRMIMRRAMSGILPPTIQWRPGKTDMAPAFNYGFVKFGREILIENIVKHSGPIAEYVDIKSLRAALTRVLNSTASNTEIIAVQRSISLALWLQKTS